MKTRSDTPQVEPTLHRGLGADLLESRRRQAEREIYKYRHLGDEAKAVEMRRVPARAQVEPTENQLSWAMLTLPK